MKTNSLTVKVQKETDKACVKDFYRKFIRKQWYRNKYMDVEMTCTNSFL